ncbi:pheromone-processing carboxypeptidase KEX1-like [Acropora millepora]|uniref:pheromone-processing carboxypeptidase KEX1-like n=1 Tax=Acropora millepora TaxID=45264 RepID=UPI001CF12E12|nr:pheromone-processing carboxypeptidase KEX1-like [Acropora millepora]
MKALVLSVLFGFVLTVSLANPINQQDAAPDSLRDVADDLESYNPERKSEDDFPSNDDEESDEDSFHDETSDSDDDLESDQDDEEDEDNDEDYDDEIDGIAGERYLA